MMTQPDTPDLWSLYRQMRRSRRFEEVVRQLWLDGLISGEMHMGTGEEAIAAGVVDHLQDGDAMALDHRGTPPLVMRGVDLVALLLELLGHDDGLCGGMGGHMHLFSRPHLSATSGIVGASGPAAVGFALAGRHLRPDSVAVAFFGEGAMNEGMVMESLNLAVVWRLPVLFVCKDNAWAISTDSSSVTGGDLLVRAASFGMDAVDVDGGDVQAVWQAVQNWIPQARRGGGPAFLRARCTHLDGHFLGDPFLQAARQPIGDTVAQLGSMLRAMARVKGAPLKERVASARAVVAQLQAARTDHSDRAVDPVARTRDRLRSELPRLHELEQSVNREIEQARKTSLKKVRPAQEEQP